MCACVCVCVCVFVCVCVCVCVCVIAVIKIYGQEHLVSKQSKSEQERTRARENKCQIGFLANDSTTDHICTQGTLIADQDNQNKSNVFSHLVDFKKSF